MAKRVTGETQDLPGLLGRVFPKLRCFDCDHCPLSETKCEYAAEREIRGKIKDAMAKSHVSQRALLEKVAKFF